MTSDQGQWLFLCCRQCCVLLYRDSRPLDHIGWTLWNAAILSSSSILGDHFNVIFILAHTFIWLQHTDRAQWKSKTFLLVWYMKSHQKPVRVPALVVLCSCFYIDLFCPWLCTKLLWNQESKETKRSLKLQLVFHCLNVYLLLCFIHTVCVVFSVCVVLCRVFIYCTICTYCVCAVLL